MTPNLSDITYFMEVAETLNISRAAERLGITQPSLSSAIKRLESSIGVDLLVRSRTGVQLTKAGKELVAKGRLLILSWEQLRSEVGKRKNEVSGEYIIGCHPSVGLYTLTHFLGSLMQTHPDLEINLVHDLSRKITEGVISFEIDFGIVVNPFMHPDLVIKELCTDQVQLWISKDASPTQDIRSEDAVLICDRNLHQAQTLLTDLQKKKLSFKRVIHSSNLEVIANLTAAGVGIGILPKRVATRISSYQLKPLGSGMPTFKDRVCLVYRADMQKTQGAQTIIKAIRNSQI